MSNQHFLQKIERDFSTTKKFHDYIRKPTARSGYIEVAQGLLSDGDDGYPIDQDNSAFYRFISGSIENLGNKIYERIDRFADNITDLDTCELHALYSMAKQIGYEGDLTFLTFEYPKEILELLNIFSVKKDLVLNTFKLLNPDQLGISGIFPALSADPTEYTSFPLMDGYIETLPDSPVSARAYSITDWVNIQALSSEGYLTPEYNFIPDDKYVNFIDTSFEQCISAFVFLKYRYEELYNIDNLVATSGYIWQHITNRLDESLLYLTNRNKDKTIIDTKLRLGVALSFNEVEALDSIETGKKRLFDFTQSEQLVIAAEIGRREKEKKQIPNLQRWKAERERKVVEYFRFIEKFNEIDPDIYFTQYPLDETKLELVGNRSSSFLYVTDSYTFNVDTDYIHAAAKSLRNIALKISYLRETLKTLAQRNTLKGTSFLLEYTLSELFKKFFFNPTDNWRFTSGNTSNLRLLSAEQDPEFDVKVIEYFDTSNYFNISALPEYSPLQFDTEEANVFTPYWLNEEVTDPSIEATYIKAEEISAFYKHQLGIEFDTVTDLSGIEYQEFLQSFLTRLYKTAALSAYNTKTACSFEYISGQNIWGVVSGARWLHDNTETALFDGSSISADIVFEDYLKAHISGISTDTVMVSATTSSFVPAYKQISGGSIILQPNLDNQIIFGGYAPTGEYTVYGTPTKFTIEQVYLVNPATYTDLFYYNILDNAEIYQMVSGIVLGNIYPVQDISPSATSGISAQFIANVPSAFDRKFVDPNADVFYRYTGLVSGVTPYYNWLNTTHPSIALHPFIQGLIEIGDEMYRSILRLSTQVMGTVKYDFDKISRRINDYGYTVNSWMSDNTEYIHYVTHYEYNPNLDANGIENKNIGIDGAWNINALNAYLNNSTSFIASVSAGTNEYYQGLGLSLSECQHIAQQLSSVSGSAEEGLNSIRGLKDKRIYKYSTDLSDNHYMLYKDDITYDISGRMWMRYANHPLALPFANISGIDTLSQYNTNGHSQFANAVNNALDFSIVGAWIHLIYGDNLQPNVAFGQIIPDTPQYRVIRDLYHNYEGFTLKGTGRTYVGMYNQQGTLNTVSIVAEPSAYCALPYHPESGRYLAALHFDSFDPDVGPKFFNRNISVAYNTIKPNMIYYLLEDGNKYVLPDGGYYVLPGSDFGGGEGTSLTRNIFRLGKGKEVLAVGYDSVIPLSGNNAIQNVFGDTPYNEYHDLYQCTETLSATNVPVSFPDTGVTLIYFDQEVNDIQPSRSANTLYNIPFSRLGFVGIFPPDDDNYYNNFNELFRTDYHIPKINHFYIELFTDITPSAHTPLRVGRFLIDNQKYECFINFDKYRAYENVPVSGLYFSDAAHTEDTDYIVRSLETPLATDFTEFIVLNRGFSGFNIVLEFDNEELGKTLSAITEDGKYLHQFRYAGRSGFSVSSSPIPAIDNID